MTESPKITSLTWGRIEVAGLGAFKDVKLWPGGGREWDWNETGTRHSPGVQPGDVDELVDQGVTVIVVGCGMQGRLGIAPQTLAQLNDAGLSVKIHQTEEAVAEYDRLRRGSAVGALIHSTC